MATKFKQNQVTVMYWPVLSFNIYRTENLWRKLAIKVYSNKRQFETVQDLKVHFQKKEEGGLTLFHFPDDGCRSWLKYRFKIF